MIYIQMEFLGRPKTICNLKGDKMNSDQSALWGRIQNMNLDPIRFSLANRDNGEGSWEVSKIDEVETLYRQYLFLTQVAEYGCSIVPSFEIDQFWHTHILDTAKYMEDCKNTFGSYLHHFPYFRVKGEQGHSDLQDAFLSTGELFKQFFGEIPLAYSCSNDTSVGQKNRKANCCGIESDRRHVAVLERPMLRRVV